MTILRNSVLHYSELLISQFGNWELRKLYRIHTVLHEAVIEWGVSSYDRCMQSRRLEVRVAEHYGSGSLIYRLQVKRANL